jgi:hypothetical protein
VRRSSNTIRCEILPALIEGQVVATPQTPNPVPMDMSQTEDAKPENLLIAN